MLNRHDRIIKDRAIVADDWAVLRLDEGEDAATVDVPEGKVIVPLAVWLAQKATLANWAPACAGVTAADAVPTQAGMAAAGTGTTSVVPAQAGAQSPARRPLGVWLASHERPEVLKGELHHFDVVAVDFPKFSDGRGMSIAYNLRERLGWTGELRAIGDVLRDQLFSMHRVGFNAFATRQDRKIEDALLGLTVFSEVYAASVDIKQPLFRRHVRGGQPEHNDIGAGI